MIVLGHVGGQLGLVPEFLDAFEVHLLLEQAVHGLLVEMPLEIELVELAMPSIEKYQGVASLVEGPEQLVGGVGVEVLVLDNDLRRVVLHRSVSLRVDVFEDGIGVDQLFEVGLHAKRVVLLYASMSGFKEHNTSFWFSRSGSLAWGTDRPVGRETLAVPSCTAETLPGSRKGARRSAAPK